MHAGMLQMIEEVNRPGGVLPCRGSADVLDADDVGLVATEFLFYEGRPFYPAGALNRAHVTEVWLGIGTGIAAPQSDLIFQMPPFEDQAGDLFLYEIILRTAHGAAYGGWAFGGDLTVSDEYWAGHHIIETEFRGETLTFTYDPQTGRYRFNGADLLGFSTGEIRAMAKNRHRD